jgi:hypothetical protein
MDLPVIVEAQADNGEEETLRTNKGLYRAPVRNSLSRDNSVQRKNRGIIQNAGLAPPLSGGSKASLPPQYKANYHSSNPNVHHSVQVKQNMRLYRDLNDK